MSLSFYTFRVGSRIANYIAIFFNQHITSVISDNIPAGDRFIFARFTFVQFY